MGHPVHLAPGPGIRRRYGGRVDAEIEQRGRDGAAAHVSEMVGHAEPTRPVEGPHQRPVEENQIHHDQKGMCSERVTPQPRPVFTRVRPDRERIDPLSGKEQDVRRLAGMEGLTRLQRTAQAETVGAETHEGDHVGDMLLER